MVRAKARELRVTRQMPITDIAAELGLSKSTVYSWVHDLELPATRSQRQKESQRRGTAAMAAKAAARRQEAYDESYADAERLLSDRRIRDFVVLYLAEGYRKNRNKVSFSNSSPRMITFAHDCMRRLAGRDAFTYSFQYHADQDPEQLRGFWAERLGIASERIKSIPKTNSGHLQGRLFTCEFGVFQVGVNDTMFRARLQALMDVVQEQWAMQL
jgi:excisionase family DNA binding protein